jgi:hypothetical protein
MELGHECKDSDLLASVDSNVGDDPIVGHVSTCHWEIIKDSGQRAAHYTHGVRREKRHGQCLLRHVLASSMVSVIVPNGELYSHNHGQQTISA